MNTWTPSDSPSRSARNLTLSSTRANCNIFSKCILCCGRVLSSGGIYFYPRRVDWIRNVQLPPTGTYLRRFVYEMQWMRSSIPAFTVVIHSLSEFLEKVYKAAGKRTWLVAAQALIFKLDWGKTKQNASNRCKAALKHQVIVAHCEISRELFLYTDIYNLFGPTPWNRFLTETVFSLTTSDIILSASYAVISIFLYLGSSLWKKKLLP